MLIEHLLDASEMEHPEPFEKSIAIISHMQLGEYYRLLHRRIPYPLFDFLKNFSMSYVVTPGETTAYEIIIFYPENIKELKQAGILKEDVASENVQ